MGFPTWGMVCVFAMLFDSAVSVCGGYHTGTSGIVESPNYPNVYPRSQGCQWTIESPPGTSIFIKFIDFQLEPDDDCDDDFVRVNDALIDASLYGSRLCGNHIPKSVRSSGNGVKIYFESDYYSHYRGFKLQWKVSNILTLHTERMSWSDAHGACAEDGGSLVSEYIEENVIGLMKQSNISTVWKGKYYTPWAWLMGCYSFEATDWIADYVESKSNEMIECVNHCNMTNYFGLQGKTCFCFDTFGGTFVSSNDHCTTYCPGNDNERCGGKDTLTIYMNNICYNESTQWQGTVSTTSTGKQCLLWADVSQVNSNGWFPDGSVNDASNFCRDPDSSSYLWCYISQTESETCDVPRCIKTGNKDTYPCMVYKKPIHEEFQFIQQRCNVSAYAICASNDRYLVWSHYHGTWFYAKTRSSGYNSECKSLAGPRIFRLIDSHVDDFQWFGLSRDLSTDSEIIPRRTPEKCFRLSKEEEHAHENVVDCDQRNAFICEHAPLTCGEHFNSSMNGTFGTPDHNGDGYGAFQHCVWVISVCGDHFVSLSIDGRIENSYKCRSDFLKVYDEGSGDIILLCDEITIRYNSTGSTVIITFRSDGTMNNYEGVIVSWIAVHVPTTTHVTIVETTTLSTTPTTSASYLLTNTNKHSDNGGISGKLFEGGTLAGTIVGVLAAVTLLFGTIVILIRRRTHADNSKQSSVKNSSNGITDVTTSDVNMPERNPGTNEATRIPSAEMYQNLAHDTALVENLQPKEDTERMDTGGGTVSLNTNHVIYQKDSCEYSVVVKLGKGELQAKHESVTSEVYNTLNAPSEPTENYYENKDENVYNRFNDSQEVYDHTATLPRQQNNTKLATGLELYDKFKEEEDVYNCSSTLQRQRNDAKQGMDQTDTYSNMYSSTMTQAVGNDSVQINDDSGS